MIAASAIMRSERLYPHCVRGTDLVWLMPPGGDRLALAGVLVARPVPLVFLVPIPQIRNRSRSFGNADFGTSVPESPGT